MYCGVNAIAPWKRTRTRDSVGVIRHVFLEADRDGPGVLARIAARSDLPEPSYILHSSPNRVHVFWRVERFDAGYVEPLQKRLANELGTDTAATPATQTTRLPGFNNHKYASAHLVTVEYGDLDRVYTPADFPAVRVSGDGVRYHTTRPIVRGPARRASLRVDERSAMDRARRYLERVPPAIAGQHGDAHTFRVCCRLVRGFALGNDQALCAISDWNTRCQPPWSERELVDKLRRARRYGREPIGGMLSNESQSRPSKR
jgi:hypothetical protein